MCWHESFILLGTELFKNTHKFKISVRTDLSQTSLPMSASGMNPQATPKIDRNLTLTPWSWSWPPYGSPSTWPPSSRTRWSQRAWTHPSKCSSRQLSPEHISNIRLGSNLVVKVFCHLMQKTAVHCVPTSTRHQTQGQIFPDLTFPQNNLIVFARRQTNYKNNLIVFARRQKITRIRKHRIPVIPRRQPIEQFMEQTIPRHAHLRKISLSEEHKEWELSRYF